VTGLERTRECAYLTPKARVLPGAIAGAGVFATEPISKHELVAFWAGHAITYAEMRALPPGIADLPVQVWFDTFLGPTRPEEIEAVDRMNHSCEPNCGVRGSVALVARRDIAPGEELTFDYGTTDTVGLEMECKCGAPTCRGVVTSDDWKDPAFRARNEEYLSLYIHELVSLLQEGRCYGIPPTGIPALETAKPPSMPVR
jgi:hypothetical protein